MEISFTKWHGCGNDFVLINDMDGKLFDSPSLAKAMCARHYGVGADGMIVVRPSDKAAFRMAFYNPDGSEAEMCGNGIRCFARLVYEEGLTQETSFTIETGAGVLRPTLRMENGVVTAVRVDMGEPILVADEIPVAGFGVSRVVAEPIEVDGKTYAMTCVSMGNPHCIVFVDDIEAAQVPHVGPLFERHERFPRRVNTEFVEVRDRTHLRMRVWERGAAITLACGTGACATLVAAVLNDKTEREATIELDGGTLTVAWGEDNHVYMTGPAERVFAGTWTA